MISSAVHYRLLRLHKPYSKARNFSTIRIPDCHSIVSRGYSDNTYQTSTTGCVDSALAILQSITKYWSASVAASPFFTLHCIEAVLVIFGVSDFI